MSWCPRARRPPARLIVPVAALVLAPLALPGKASPGLPAVAEHTTDHLIVAAYPAEATVVPGRTVTVVVEVHPKPGYRVYAPGQLGYLGVNLDVPIDGIVTAVKTRLPEPTEFVFPPTGERTLVFERPFRMEVVLSISGTREARERIARGGGRVSIAGRFEYQACDDVLCYRPVRIPVTFSVEAIRQPAGPKR
jgi:hypothetical protein